MHLTDEMWFHSSESIKFGIGNNPMVGCTVACAVDVAQALNK